MGFITLPVSAFLYWLMLRSKKESPFPKGGLLRLLIAGVVSVVLSSVLSVPISGIVIFFRFGFSNLSGWISAIRDGGIEALTEQVANTLEAYEPTFVWKMIDMFFSAALLEEGLKFLTCRIAIRKEGMIRTRMDAVAAFAIVGITFEMLENIAFGMEMDFINALGRSLACAHFIFGVIMGFFYGKYLETGLKKYRLLSIAVPVFYHALTNALMSSAQINKIFNILGTAAAMSHILVTIVMVIIVLRWQKNRTLDVPVLQK